MVTLPQLAATPISLQVTNQSWQLTPLTLGDVAELEQLADATSLEQLQSWIETPAGTVYVLWLALRTRQPQVTLSTAGSIVDASTGCTFAGTAEPELRSQRTTDGQSYVNWAGLFRYLARRHGWTPDQIAALTISQAQALVGLNPAYAGRILFSRSEFREWRRNRDVPSAEAPSKALSTNAQRLAAFRQRLSEVYAPLSAVSLKNLANAARRPRRPSKTRPLPRRPSRRRPTHTERTLTQPTFHLSPQIHWHLHALIVALRSAATTTNDLSPMPEFGGPRIARFQ